MADEVLDWLMAGDPSIRWQTMRDLFDAPKEAWEAERRTLASEGWTKQFLDLQDSEGTWAQGIYSPKWTSTTYTLLTLIDFGIEREHPAARMGAKQIFEKGIAQRLQNGRLGSLLRNDVCVWGFYLHVCSYFGITEHVILELAELLLEDQMPDGGWNCRRQRVKSTRHGSFHTTFNVLEGLRAAARFGQLDSALFQESEARAMEFMLAHRLYKSDKTGEVIDEHFTQFCYPTRWHYDVLRGLDYMRDTPYIKDPRVGDALELLKSKEQAGVWCTGKYSGVTYFNLEPGGRRSRWNTLRALRVLRAASTMGHSSPPQQAPVPVWQFQSPLAGAVQVKSPALGLSYQHKVYCTTQESPQIRTQFCAEDPRIVSLRLFQNNWDGYGAPAPTSESITRARSILSSLTEDKFLVDRVIPSAAGGVFIYMKASDCIADIEVFNSGEIIASTSWPRKPGEVWEFNEIESGETFERIHSFLAGE